MNKLLPSLMLAMGIGSGSATAALTESFHFTALNLALPDGNAAGVSDTRTLTTSLTTIESVGVTLDISGDFNGDIYAYLQHESGLAVLLNRVGRTATDPYGYDDSGLNITLRDDAANGDIHTYRGVTSPAPEEALTGTWQPDGRDIDPDVVLDTSGRTAMLSTFQGLTAGGAWTLYLADLEFGGNSVLNGWSLEITAVPEPIELALIVFGVVFGVSRLRRCGWPAR